MKLICLLSLVGGASAFLQLRKQPVDVQSTVANSKNEAWLKSSLQDGAKLPDLSGLAPACSAVSCARITCHAPFELTMNPGQCCPICWAPDHKVALDRHVNHGDLGFRAKPAAEAPMPHCGGVKCFVPVCLPGQAIGYHTGSCCKSCV